MAVPVIKGEKTAGERFPGAERTYSIEAMMQDRKALQAGTSHFLGQNFARASKIQFLGADGTQQFAWTTSWGVSTRLIGGLLMTHSDDDGFVLPPRLAPQHVVIVPIFRSDDEKVRVLEYCRKVAAELRAQRFQDAPVRVLVDMTSIGSLTLTGSQTALTLTASAGGRTVLAETLTFAHQEPRNDSPQSGGLVYRDEAGVIDPVEDATYTFVVGPGDAEGIEMRSVELVLRGGAAGIDPRLVPIGYVLMAVGFIGFVLALRGARHESNEPPKPRWGRGG
jgi:hypothetical protein